MPIISTLGALTYSKVSISTGTDWRYWNLLIKNSNTSLSAQINNTIFDSTNQYIYGVGYTEQITNTYNPIILKLNNTANSYTQPNVSWITRESGGNFSNVSLTFSPAPSQIITINGDSNLIVTGTTRVNTRVQLNYDISPSTGNVNFAKGYAPRPLSNGGTGAGIYRYSEGITFDSSNNYYTVGSYNQQINNNPGSVNKRFGISKFNGSSGDLITTTSFGPTANANVGESASFLDRVQIDSTDNNLIITGSVPGSNLFSIANISSDLTTINWQKSFSNTFAPSDLTVIDNNSFTIGTFNSSVSTSAIVKIDSTGNVVWNKQISNCYISSITVNNANTSQLIIAGLYTNANVNYSLISSIENSTGNLIWQTSLSYSNGNGFWSDTQFNVNSVKTNNNQILLSGNLQSVSGSRFTGCIMTLPINGTVPGDGVTALEPNLTLTISSGNFVSISNSNIALTTSNYSLNTPLSSQFGTANITSNSNTLTTTSFINLA